MKPQKKVSEFDSSFGNEGIVEVRPPGNFRNALTDLAIDNDDRLIIYGRYQRETPIADQPGVSRIENNGQIDNTFGDNQDGFTTIPAEDTTTGADSLAITKTGQFFVTGLSSVNLPLFNYDANGKLINSLIIDVNPQRTFPRLVMTGEGKLIVAGGATEGVILYGRNADGSQDNGFGDQGKKTVLTANRYVGTRAVLADGKHANFYLAGESGNDGFIARFSNSGESDNNFATEGLYTIKSNSAGTVNCQEIVLLDSGAVLAAVNSAGGDGLSCYLICLTSKGQLDPHFNRGEPIRLPGEIVEGLTLAKDGRIIATHRSTTEGNKISVYLANGLPDPDFGERGTLALILDNGVVTRIKKVIVQPDGKFVISALSGPITTLVRLIP